MVSGWLSVLGASLLGSLHCVGMCGGLVSFYAAGERARGGSPWRLHLAYHLTRATAYALLGAAAGQLGSALNTLGSSLGFGALGAALALLAILSWGLPIVLGTRARVRLLELRRGRSLGARLGARAVAAVSSVFMSSVFMSSVLQRVRDRPPLWRASALGLSSALLPCGWLYAFVVLAAGTGSVLHGAGLLVAFWAGTVPALLGLGIGIERISPSMRARLPRISAALIVLSCAVNIASRWPSALAADVSGSSPAPRCHGQH